MLRELRAAAEGRPYTGYPRSRIVHHSPFIIHRSFVRGLHIAALFLQGLPCMAARVPARPSQRRDAYKTLRKSVGARIARPR